MNRWKSNKDLIFNPLLFNFKSIQWVNIHFDDPIILIQSLSNTEILIWFLSSFRNKQITRFDASNQFATWFAHAGLIDHHTALWGSIQTVIQRNHSLNVRYLDPNCTP